MDEHFEVLGLTKDASEAEIRQRYLELVRAFSPERAPERFAAIHAAYQCASRPGRAAGVAAFQLSRCESDSLESLASDLRQSPAPRPASGRRLAVSGRLSMNDRVDVDAILDRFREWLEAARAEDAKRIRVGRATFTGSLRPFANSGSSIWSRNSRPCGTR